MGQENRAPTRKGKPVEFVVCVLEAYQKDEPLKEEQEPKQITRASQLLFHFGQSSLAGRDQQRRALGLGRDAVNRVWAKESKLEVIRRALQQDGEPGFVPGSPSRIWVELERNTEVGFPSNLQAPSSRRLRSLGRRLLNLIDFAGVFSGNAIAPPRSYALRLVTSF